jgi:hypothetical protein
MSSLMLAHCSMTSCTDSTSTLELFSNYGARQGAAGSMAGQGRVTGGAHTLASEGFFLTVPIQQPKACTGYSVSDSGYQCSEATVVCVVM